ncbi:hypothetical protein MnTg04_00499 [bacterium MnTg04]|nr:hypothetical protein MnTg04_00499 [bacterium MnTg04]
MGGSFDAVHSRHPNLQQHKIRLRRVRPLKRFTAVCRLGDDLPVVVFFDQAFQTLPCRGLIVDDENFHSSFSTTGRNSEIRYLPGVCSTSTLAFPG